MPGTIYALANQKGGVGKTTTAVNLAACLAEAGEQALLVDLDPQANATSGLGEKANGVSSYDLLDGAPVAEIARHDALRATSSSCRRSPSSPARRSSSRGTTDGERYLQSSLAGARDRYGFVFLDCPPSFGTLTVNALAAADRVIVPVQAEYYALEGLSQLLGSIELVKARLNPKLGIAGILITMVDGRTRLAAEVEAEVRRHFGDLVFTTTVPRSVRLAEAPSHGLPAIAYDRRSTGAEAYWKVAMELVDRLPTTRPRPRPRGPDRRRRGRRTAARAPAGRRDSREPAPAAPALRARGDHRPRELDQAARAAPADRRAAAAGGRLRADRRRAPLARRPRGRARDPARAHPRGRRPRHAPARRSSRTSPASSSPRSRRRAPTPRSWTSSSSRSATSPSASAARSRRSRTGCGCSSCPRRCSGWSPAAS